MIARHSRPTVFLWLVIVCLVCPVRSPLAQEKAPAARVLQEQVFTQVGELPIILSAPHGGTGTIEGVPERNGEGMKTGGAGFFAGRDTGTEELAYDVAAAIEKRFGKKPYAVVAKVHRKFVDFNRPVDIAIEDQNARPTYDYYQKTLETYCKEVTSRFRSGLLLDIHGQATDRETVFRGTRNGSTVKHLRATFGEEAHTGPKSLFGLLNSRGWKTNPTSLSDKEYSGYTGGHIVGTAGSLDGTVINAIQLEFGGEYRVKSRRQATADTLADAVFEFSQAYLKIPASYNPIP
jgi:hypothetical protein